MRDIKINNEEVQKTLDKLQKFISQQWENGELEKDLKLNCKDSCWKDWTSTEYMHRVIQMGRQHEGFPERMQSFHGLQPGKVDDGADVRMLQKYRDVAQETNVELMTELSAHRNTLVTVYPPGGFISWHNNANAAGYNVIFSWSENGDGWFDYWDLDKKERVRVQDVPGWQCKMGYFGGYHQQDRLCFHAAATNCLRISVAYVFQEAEDMWESIIEDIEDPV